MVRVEKSRLKKLLSAKVDERVHVAQVVHRPEWRSDKRLDPAVVDAVRFEASRRKPGKDEPKPYGDWYVAPNRNRIMIFKNDAVQVRVWQNGTCRVLPRRPLNFESLKGVVQTAFFLAGLDLTVCQDITGKLEPQTRHRVFKVGTVTPFKIDFYKDSLGITIKADGSHPEHIEVPEDWPTWIKPQLQAIADQTEVIRRLTEQLRLHLQVMEGIRDVSEEQKTSTQKLTGAVEKLIKTLEVRPETAEVFNELYRLLSHLDRKITLRGKERFPWEI